MLLLLLCNSEYVSPSNSLAGVPGSDESGVKMRDEAGFGNPSGPCCAADANTPPVIGVLLPTAVLLRNCARSTVGIVTPGYPALPSMLVGRVDLPLEGCIGDGTAEFVPLLALPLPPIAEPYDLFLDDVEALVETDATESTDCCLGLRVNGRYCAERAS